MQILINKKPNGVGNYSYQLKINNFIEIGTFKTYEEGLLYAEQEGMTKKIHEGKKFIVLETVHEKWRNK